MNDFSEYGDHLLALFHNCQTLSLATLDANGAPSASLTPFLYHDNCFWIFVSSLSRHTQHLLENPKASILIREETTPTNPFIVKRASIHCDVTEEMENKDAVLDLMAAKLGETVGLLRQLGDFHLIKLSPTSGQYIAGFGQAFDINMDQLSLTHINPARNNN